MPTDNPTNPRPARWTPACSLTELEVGGARVFRHAGKQIALFRTGEAEVFAVDNHCPHEGYPLVQGYVKDCVLTCAWHNFKFELNGGRCIKGDEDVRTWPLRISGTQLEVDVAAAEDATPSDPQPIYASLEQGLLEYQLGRVARDVARLLAAGRPPLEVAAFGARFDARRAQYGSTHALPVAVDVLRYGAWRSDLDLVLPLLAALDMAADASVRRPERARPAPRSESSLGTHAQVAQELLRLVEDEDAGGAEALVRGAVRAGWRAQLRALLAAPLAEHHLSFGHPVIYHQKLFELLERSDYAAADELCGAFVFNVINSTREDTLPPWKPFRDRLDALDDELAAWWAGGGPSPRTPAASAPAPTQGAEPALERLFTTILDGQGRELVAELAAALRQGWSIDTLCGVVVAAAAERFGRFDVAIDRDPEVQDGWLFVTHTLTHAAAVRSLLAEEALSGEAGPRLLRLLFFAARFVHGARPLDRGAVAGQPAPAATTTPGCADAESILQAVRERDPELAAARARVWLDPGVAPGSPGGATAEAAAGTSAAQAGLPELEPLERGCAELALDAGLARPIVIAHAIKTTFASFDEARALDRDAHTRRWRALPVAALVRLLASPITERSLVRTAYEAVRFVGHGEVPKLLSS